MRGGEADKAIHFFWSASRAFAMTFALILSLIPILRDGLRPPQDEGVDGLEPPQDEGEKESSQCVSTSKQQALAKFSGFFFKLGD